MTRSCDKLTKAAASFSSTAAALDAPRPRSSYRSRAEGEAMQRNPLAAPIKIRSVTLDSRSSRREQCAESLCAAVVYTRRQPPTMQVMRAAIDMPSFATLAFAKIRMRSSSASRVEYFGEKWMK